MKKHKHSELIKAWADGAEIECQPPWLVGWVDAIQPSWNDDIEYRIKPKPTPDVVKYVSVKLHWHTKGIARWDNVEAKCANLKIVFNGETGELKESEVFK